MKLQYYKSRFLFVNLEKGKSESPLNYSGAYLLTLEYFMKYLPEIFRLYLEVDISMRLTVTALFLMI